MSNNRIGSGTIEKFEPIPGARCWKCHMELKAITLKGTLIAYICSNEECELLGVMTRRLDLIDEDDRQR